ncbi:4Fe-4S binding protein [Hydrogenimonas thermophila]|uniref:4Fe-4S binding domain-containing protein n=1 Tax=Hydrogenimonas thermophila TaxID=223786 RepID=A0A1I5M7E5_9BACT|nr:4Fe-4S binding protein [Hydrogenimonas thermophila]SFP04866.1 4Fe-4S binding domain-containing protein [Hydrogenimonas thermophila]
MSKLYEKIQKLDIRKLRFWIQLLTFILFVYGGYLAIDFGRELPIFSCGYNEEKGGMCYFMPLQHQLARPYERLFSFASIGVLTAFLTFLVWFIIFNKAWCGYVCPLGTLQDWITAIRKRLHIPYSSYSENTYRHLKKIKYIFLFIVLIFPLLLGSGILDGEWRGAFCKMCPGRLITPMFTGDFSQWSIDFSSNTAIFLTAFGIAFTILFFVGSFLKKRFFCFFCPMSAMHYILSPLAILKLKKSGDKCTKCGDCYRVCDMQIKDIADDVESTNILRDDCILCLKCVAACPEEDALRLDIVNMALFRSTKGGFAKRMGFEGEFDAKK